jgi:hypothetical protein
MLTRYYIITKEQFLPVVVLSKSAKRDAAGDQSKPNISIQYLVHFTDCANDGPLYEDIEDAIRNVRPRIDAVPDYTAHHLRLHRPVPSFLVNFEPTTPCRLLTIFFSFFFS